MYDIIMCDNDACFANTLKYREKLYSFMYVIEFWCKYFRKNHSYIIYE